MTHLKIKSSLFPVKGLLTTLGATLILISLALDFSYGKSPKLSHLNFEIIKKLIFWRENSNFFVVIYNLISANLNTYVISYLRSKDHSISYSDWIFVTTSKTFVQGSLMPFMGGLERLVGTRICILIGCIIYT